MQHNPFQYTVKELLKELSNYHPDTVIQIAVLGEAGTEQLRSVLAVISLSEVIDTNSERLTQDVIDTKIISHGIGSPESQEPVTVQALHHFHTNEVENVVPIERVTSDGVIYIATSVTARIPTHAEKFVSKSVD